MGHKNIKTGVSYYYNRKLFNIYVVLHCLRNDSREDINYKIKIHSYLLIFVTVYEINR